MRTLNIRLTILKMLMSKDLYGYKIYKKLLSEGLEIEIGRLYKILLEMQHDGILESYWQKSEKGPRKRVYKIGKKGKDELDFLVLNAIHTVHSAYVNYLKKLPTETNVFFNIAKLSADALKDGNNLAYVVTNSSPMNEMTIESILQIAPTSKAFIVKPNKVELHRQFENTTVLDGWSDNLPLKDNYLDLLFLTGIPKDKNFEKYVQEWCRVLNENGRLAILIPTIISSRIVDPLNLGDFIERWEHQTFKSSEFSNMESLKTELQKHCFSEIEEKQIVHMTLMIAYKLSTNEMA